MPWIDRLRTVFRRHRAPDGPSCPVPASMPTNDEMRTFANKARDNRDDLVSFLSGFEWGPEVLRQSNVVASEFEEEQWLHRLDRNRGPRASR